MTDPKKIKIIRKGLGLTIKEAAHSVYVSERAWSLWEKGDRKMAMAYWELFLIKLTERAKGKELQRLKDEREFLRLKTLLEH